MKATVYITLATFLLAGKALGYQSDGWRFHFGEGAVAVQGCSGSVWGPAQFPAAAGPGWLVACDGEPDPPPPPYTGLYCPDQNILAVRRYAPSTFVSGYADYSYLRLQITFAADEEPVSANLYSAADDAMKIFINGQEVGIIGGCQQTLGHNTDILDFLQPGLNTFEAIHQDAACCGSDFSLRVDLEVDTTEPPAVWTTEVVDSGADVGQWSALDLDAGGRPHIAYFDVANADARFAERTGDSWAIETIDSAGDVGRYTSLAMDDAGGAYVCYRREGSNGLQVARRSGGVWSHETLDPDGGVGSHTSLVVDQSGVPHITYHRDAAGIKYAKKAQGSWLMEFVDTGRLGWFTSLALDAQGNPHASYYDIFPADLRYAVTVGDSWVVEVVDVSGDAGYGTSLELDANGRPHISYYDREAGDLKYAVKIGGIWELEIVDGAGDVGMWNSLELDRHGNPHISYYDQTNGDLKYAYTSDGAWVIDVVDEAGVVGEWTSLRIDDQGCSHISYYDRTAGNLKYAVRQGTCPSTCPSDEPRVVIGDSQGIDGDIVVVDVGLQLSPVAIDAVAMRLAYDASVLSFLPGESECGDLTGDWIVCGANEVAPGTIAIGGFGTTSIPPGSTGSIAQLAFRVLCGDCVEGDESYLTASEFDDDLAGMEGCCGIFTYGEQCVSDGDVDGSGGLTPGDALCAFKIFLHGQTVPGDCDAGGDCEVVTADVNCNESVTPGDALSIFYRWLEGGAPEPCFGQDGAAPWPLAGGIARGKAIGNMEGGAVGSREQAFSLEVDRGLRSESREISIPLVMMAVEGPAAFGLEVDFDSDALRFAGLEVRQAAQSWQAMDGRETAPGHLILGGFDPWGLSATLVQSDLGESVPDGNGVVEIARLRFTRIGEGAGIERVRWTEQLLGARLMDDRAVPGSLGSGALTLGSPFPNPGRESVWATLIVPGRESRDVEVSIYDVRGRYVASVLQRDLPAGTHRLEWDRTDGNGVRVPSGIYFMRLEVSHSVVNRKLVILD